MNGRPTWEDGRCGRKAGGTDNRPLSAAPGDRTRPHVLACDPELRHSVHASVSRQNPVSILRHCLHPPPACTQLSRGSVSSVSISAEAGRLFPENSLGNQVELGRAVRCQAGNGLTNGCWEVATCQRGLSCFVSSEHGRARSRTANSGSYTGLSTA